MSAPKVRADYQSLQQVAQSFGQAANQLKQRLQAIKQALEVLQAGDWVGQGATAFYQEMGTEVIPALTRLANACDTASQVTAQINQLMQTAERDAARVFRATNSGGAPAMEDGGGGAGGSGGGTGSGGGRGSGGGGGSGGGSGGGDTPKSQVEDLLKTSPLDTAKLFDIVQNASQDERDAIWQDTALMGQLKDNLSAQEYLNLLPALRVFETGGPTTTAAEADSRIQDYLKDKGYDTDTAGRQVSGQVSVVSGDNWDAAGEARYGHDRWFGDGTTPGKRDTLNGFVDDKGRVWINKDKANSGTMVHEAVHKYSDEALINTSQPLNEGVTEYFTRQVMSDSGMNLNDRAGIYESNHDTVSSLVGLVGESTVADAYFSGNVDGLKQACLDKGMTDAQWDTFIQATKDKDWATAESTLAAVTGP